MEKTIQQKLEEARALMHKAEGALEAAQTSGIEEVIQAAEHALSQTREAVTALEDAAALEAERADAETLEEAVEIAGDEREEAEEAAEKLEEAAQEAGDAAAAASAAAALDALDGADEALDDAGEAIEDILEEQAGPKKKKTGLIAGICLGVAALLGGGYYYYTNYYLPAAQAPAEEQTAQAVMPDLTLETAEVAEKLLAGMGIESDVLFVSSEKVPAGVVTLQSISAGQPVEDKVVLYVSMGPAPTPTPDRGPLPTPTPSPTPKPERTKAPIIVKPVVTPCPTG